MDKIDNIGLTRMLTQSYDFDGFTTQEVWSRIAQRMNIIIEHFNYLESTVKDKQELIDKKLEYLLNEGLTIEIAKAIKEKIDDGTIKDIVDEQIFTELNKQLDTIKSNHAIYNDRELKEGNNYALDVANLVGQGLYQTGSPENNKFRCAVFHNYVDTEVLTIDNVGEMPSIFVRNARNPERRIDKGSNFIPMSNYLDFRQGFMNEDGTSHSFVQMFKMNYLGDMFFPNNRDDVVTHKIYTVSETLASKDYAFQIGSYYNTRFIARFDYENNKSALNIALDTSKTNTQLLSPNMGLKLTANKGNAYLESLNGNVVLKGSNGAYVYKDGANLPIISMVSNKPETSTSNGNKGDCFVDSTHLYICYETNKWIRIAKDSSW